MPGCTAAFCPDLEDPHGTWTRSAPRTGGVAILTCDSGYEISGPDIVVCAGVAEGVSDWSPSPGFCEAQATVVPSLAPGWGITLAALLLALGVRRSSITRRSGA